MTKLLVETTGSFILIDFENGTEIQDGRPTVVSESSFVSARAALGQIRVLDTLTDDATDEEFAKYFKESNGDTELAISAFKTSFSSSAETPTVKPRGRPAKAAE